MHPLDLVKTRLQLQARRPPALGGVAPHDPHFYEGVVDCVRKMYRHESALAYWKGVVPPVLVETPKRAVKVPPFFLTQKSGKFIQFLFFPFLKFFGKTINFLTKKSVQLICFKFNFLLILLGCFGVFKFYHGVEKYQFVGASRRLSAIALFA